MNHVGMIRKIDILGRLVIPSEFREYHNISNLDEVEVFNTEEYILVKKHMKKHKDVVQ